MSLRKYIGRWLRLPASLFTSSALVIFGVVAIGMWLAHHFFVTQVQQPRTERVAVSVAAYIEGVRTFAQVASPAQRKDFFETLGSSGKARVHVVDISKANFRLPDDQLLSEFLIQVQVAALGAQVAWHAGNGDTDQSFWFEVPVPDSEPIWLSYPARVNPFSSFAVALLFGALFSLAIAAAAWLQTGLKSQLNALGEAVERLGRGERHLELASEGTTEVVEVNKLFNRVTRHLSEAEQDREVLLAGVSHDLRTPLTKLRLGLALRANSAGDEDLVRAVDEIDAIVGQFLDLATAGKSAEPPIKLNLNEIVCETAAALEVDGYPFELNLLTLPLVCTRPVVLQRVMNNLMGNASRYSGKGLAVSTGVEDGKVFIRVSDAGPGVSISELPRLGQPFFRTEAGRSKGPGTGLGLAIVHRLLKAEGGSLLLSINHSGGLDASIRMPPAPV